MRKPLQNAFVTKLVQLQQDGKEAISGPGNWLTPPLLEVEPPATESAAELIQAMAPGGSEPDRARWHWLIGSPGNGKSTRMGAIVRQLLRNGFEVMDERGTSVEHADSDWLPYRLEVYESGKPYRFAYLVQDASVVRNPFGSECDPAIDLEGVLGDAFDRGLSLLLCTNWGVLQRLFDRGVAQRHIRSQKWFRPVKKAVERSNRPVVIRPAKRKTVFSEVSVSYEYLDNRSLLVNSNTFNELLKKATSREHWDSCSDCSSRSLCPFRSNRDDLCHPEIRKNVLNTLRRAEVLSGQTVVFREAVALISLFLAGCPNDHENGVPCQWVHSHVENNSVFNLLARRLSILLYGGASPYGLAAGRGDGGALKRAHSQQIKSLKLVRRLLKRHHDARAALKPVVDRKHLSLDLGVKRLIGPRGVITQLDPSLDPRHARHLDRLVTQVTSSPISGGEATPAKRLPGLRCIERRCIDYWNEMFAAVQGSQVPNRGPNVYFWLHRWQATCITWMAALSSGVCSLQSDLDLYLEFVTTSGTLSPDQYRKLSDLQRVLDRTLARQRDANNQHIELSPSMRLTGSWARNNLRAKLDTATQNDTHVLRVTIGRAEDGRPPHAFVLSAKSFSLLARCQELRLSDLCINPDVIDDLKRTQAQAAATSNYSLQNDDVTLIVTDEQYQEHKLRRTDGHLFRVRG